MTIDPRLQERRRTVAEDTAKRNIGRLLRALAVIVTAGGLVWLALSPWLSVAQVHATGISSSSAHAVLADSRVVAGTPLILLDTGAVEERLLADPWIASASVELDWPDAVVVEVDERVPLAWTNTSTGWARRAVDGVALPSGETPDPEMAWIDLPLMSEQEALSAPEMAGALQFVAGLPSRHRAGAIVYLEGGELWANVTGYQARLGRPIEMTEKALSLTALLAEGLPEGAVLVLVAPSNPAVSMPSSPADTDGEPAADDS